ncbi:MAG: 4-alpha-glucanotransferase [Deltaproteobacteria bacterium]|nr:4-alpha-glucanotransferase [Deltaproteobacteria bacterium]
MTTKLISAHIAALGRGCGIAAQYWDNFGKRRRTSQSVYRALLTAMGAPWEEREALAREMERRRLQPFDRLVGPVQLIPASSQRGKIAFFTRTPSPELRSAVEVQAELAGENGQRVIWTTVITPEPLSLCRGSHTLGFRTRLELPLPQPLELGYYDLTLRVLADRREETGAARLIVAPRSTYFPPSLENNRRLWGLNLPLYALRSEQNWGLGDFTDLQEVVSWTADLGAAFVGINPINARPPAPDADPSPYSPTSRQFLNFLYVNLAAAPEMQDCPEALAWIASPEFSALKARLQAGELVDYPEVYLLKRRLLGPLYQAFLRTHGPPEAPRTPRGEEFARFLAEKDESLTQFGQFCAMAEYFQQPDWRRWPTDYQNPRSPAVAEFARSHPMECGLHQYAQWLAAEQLAQVCRHAQARGLPFALYQDLALGAAAGGFDTWAYPDLFAHGASMGAPPDAFNPKGQNWGLPPFIPHRLRESGYRPFINILRASLPPGGMLRLDHVMSLFRLFWIPTGLDAAHGAYVRYPSRELLAVLALESVRNRTLIIGEDLGTVAPYIRRDLGKAGIFSYKVFYFERAWENCFQPPEDYPEQAVAAVTTHDLPTLAGWWQARDVALKESLHLYPQPGQAQADLSARQEDRRRLVEALAQRGLLAAGFTPEPQPAPACPTEIRNGVLEYLAQSRAALLEVRLEELFCVPEQQNLPGTVAQHPNWRRKMPLTLSQMRQQPDPARLAARLNRHRGN